MSLRRLPLGLRLGAAFSVLLVAIAVTILVGVTNLRALNVKEGDNAQARSIAAQRDSAQLAEGVRARAHDVARHLYVYDGDLETEDGIAAQVRADTVAVAKAVAELRASVQSDIARAAYEQVATAGVTFDRLVASALRRSRQETVAGAEDRDSSRTLYTDRLVPLLDQQLAPAVERLQSAIDTDLRASIAAGSDKAASGERQLLIAGVVALLVAILMGVLITRSIVGPVRALAARLHRVQSDDLTALQHGLEALATGDLTVAVVATTEPLDDHAADEVGEAGRTVDAVIAQSHASVAAYERTRADLGALLGGVTRSATEVNAASQQMASASGEAGRAMGEIGHAVSDLATGAERQIGLVNEVRAGGDTVGRHMAASVAGAQATADAAASVREVALAGSQTAERATAAMRGMGASTAAVTDAIRVLAGRSDEIAGIVGSITAIAEQTNLLALNAAIEAARAGEQGRGFAVVADEVRKLAEEAQGSARRIGDVLAEVQSGTREAVALVDDGARRTHEGTAVVEQAQLAFGHIADAIQDMAERVAGMAEAARESGAQAAALNRDVESLASIAEESSASTEQVAASAQETSASTQEVSASAQQLAGTAAELEALVARFRLAV